MQKILIVEDDRPIANLIKVSLAAEGYSCVCAYDGADDYITKPFQVGELTARVEAVLRRYGKAGCVLHADDVEVDIDSRVVYKAGREVELTLRNSTFCQNWYAIKMSRCTARRFTRKSGEGNIRTAAGRWTAGKSSYARWARENSRFMGTL